MRKKIAFSDTVDLKMFAAAAKAKISGKPVPLHVIFEVTHLCNLSCEYCDRHTPLPNELTFHDVSKVIEEFVRLGMIGMTLDGGEPLARRDIDKIIDKLFGLGTKIIINTNGILVPQKIQSVKKALRINVSLDGPAEYHDSMRGKGSFEKAVRGIRKAREEGVSVKLRCTMHRHNMRSVPELVRLAEELDSPIIFQPALNSLFQNTPRDGSAWEPSREEFRRTIQWLCEEKRKTKYIANYYASLKHFLYFPNRKEPPCSAGWIHVTMDPEGYLYHCGQVNREPQKINVLQYGVEEAFRRIARYGCDQCWCASLVDTNSAWGLQLSKFTHFGIDKILSDVESRGEVYPVRSEPIVEPAGRVEVVLPDLD